jgi:Na+-transporting NADH:ubiquinone oxidoreductase subunit NqrB
VTSAAVHAAIVPAHVAESPQLAVLFVLASIALLLTAAGILLRPTAEWPQLAALSLFGSLILSYLFTRLSEPVDVVGVMTKLVEAIGLGLVWSLREDVQPLPLRPWIAGMYVLLAGVAVSIVLDSHVH